MTNRSPNAGSPVYQEGWDAGHAVGYAKGRVEGEAVHVAAELALRKRIIDEAVMARLRETLAELDARWENA